VRAVALTLAALCAVGALGGCGDTLQDRPIPHSLLETMVLAPFPVYWLGGSFQGLPISEATHDPGGAFAIQYGDCLQGGQGTCVAPVRVVTSPDNSFLPGGSGARAPARIRGVPVQLAQHGATVLIPTAGVVVDVYAHDARTGAAAAAAIVPINRPGVPGAPLAAALPDTGFAGTPLPSQLPAPLRPLP
jgi:hypothetical protein